MRKSYILILTYTAVILGILYWSGLKNEKRLYDTYLIRSEGPLFAIKSNSEGSNLHTSQTKTFYSELMNFKLVEKASKKTDSKEGKALAGISLPDGNKIYFNSEPESSTSSQVFKVRNGFEKLHANLLQRENQFRKENSIPSVISKIDSKPWGKEFVITDPNGNKLIFYKSKRKKGSRLKY